MSSTREVPAFRPPERGSPGFQNHQIEALGSTLWTCVFLSHLSSTFSESYGRGNSAWWTAVLVTIPCVLAGLPGARERREGAITTLFVYVLYALAPALIALLSDGSLPYRTMSAVVIILPLALSSLPTRLSATGSVTAWSSLTAALVALNTFSVLSPMPRSMGFTMRGYFTDAFVAIGCAACAVVVGLFTAYAVGFARYERPRRFDPAELALAFAFYLNALCEEVMYRGVLLNLIMEWLPKHQILCLALGSVLFGLAQLSRDKHGFKPPNWRFAITAAVYGGVCGVAWQQTGRVTVSAVVNATFCYILRKTNKMSVE